MDPWWCVFFCSIAFVHFDVYHFEVLYSLSFLSYIMCSQSDSPCFPVRKISEKVRVITYKRASDTFKKFHQIFFKVLYEVERVSKEYRESQKVGPRGTQKVLEGPTVFENGNSLKETSPSKGMILCKPLGVKLI